MDTTALADLITADPSADVCIRSPGKTVNEFAAGEPLTCTEPEPMSMAPFVPANAKEQETKKDNTSAAFFITELNSKSLSQCDYQAYLGGAGRVNKRFVFCLMRI